MVSEFWNQAAESIKLAVAMAWKQAKDNAEMINFICAIIVPLAVIIITLIMVNR